MEHYRIKLKGKLDEKWSATFEGFSIRKGKRNTIMVGSVPDQSALHGLLTRIRDLNLTILSIDRVDPKEK